MSSPMIQMNTANMAPSPYTSVDSARRHEYGVQKNKKQTSTGGGRAWSEDEEVYLLQTRLQKMPYKHIAAHLKKTELACRLHYHQLSHGSNRRKRASSHTSSSNGSASQSPVPSHSMPSPVSEHNVLPPVSPAYAYAPQSPAQIQLPSASILLNRSASNSPSRMLNHPVAILPRPLAPRRALSDPPASLNLRLDCEAEVAQLNHSNVDKDRLRSIYEAHRISFWGVIASEYGSGASPLVLEETWKRGVVANAPLTPCGSPVTSIVRGGVFNSYNMPPMHRLPTPVQDTKVSVSALLGIDASPRSPREREIIKRMEEQRDTRDVLMAGIELN